MTYTDDIGLYPHIPCKYIIKYRVYRNIELFEGKGYFKNVPQHWVIDNPEITIQHRSPRPLT